eukprot:12223488-Alexandrium_andersonii.AAC.1
MDVVEGPELVDASTFRDMEKFFSENPEGSFKLVRRKKVRSTPYDQAGKSGEQGSLEPQTHPQSG